MSNSVLVSSDMKSMVVIDPQSSNQRLSISRKGVLVSVLGSDICATEVSDDLDKYISNLVKKIQPFYAFDMGDAMKNQLCITYNDSSNTIFVIGVTDVLVGYAVPEEISSNKVRTFGIRLKKKASEGVIAEHVILARLEGRPGSEQQIKFYLVKESDL